jgi:GAF domain-containing protein
MVRWSYEPTVVRPFCANRTGSGLTGAPLSGDESRVLAEEQAALRRVATLVARGVPSEEVFAAVTAEVGRVLSAGYAHLGRYDADGMLTSVAAWGAGVVGFPIGSRWNLGGKNVATIVSRTGRPARVESYADASGPLGSRARKGGVGSAGGTPVIVEGRLWGLIVVSTSGEQLLPVGAEARLTSFTQLVATAVANAENRAALARLAEEQAALRRVATLVARGAAADELFAVVTVATLYMPSGIITLHSAGS